MVNHGSRCGFSWPLRNCARLSQQSSGNQSDKLPLFGQLFSPIVSLHGAENEVMLGNIFQGEDNKGGNGLRLQQCL